MISQERTAFTTRVAWGRYGVSAFLANDVAEVDVLCETRLERFATLVVFHREDLSAGPSFGRRSAGPLCLATVRPGFQWRRRQP